MQSTLSLGAAAVGLELFEVVVLFEVLELFLEILLVFVEDSLVSFELVSPLLDGAPSYIIFSRQVSLLDSAVDSAVLSDLPAAAAASRARDAGEGKVLYSKSDTTLTYDGMFVLLDF